MNLQGTWPSGAYRGEESAAAEEYRDDGTLYRFTEARATIPRANPQLQSNAKRLTVL